MGRKIFFESILFIVIYTFISNYYLFYSGKLTFLSGLLLFLAFSVTNFKIGFLNKKHKSRILKIEYHGVICLLVFIFSVTVSFTLHIHTYFTVGLSKSLIFSMIHSCLYHLVLFFNGIIAVYLSSIQLGIVKRVLGIFFGPIPLINIYFLVVIVKICISELLTEDEKYLLNLSRSDDMICKTKYPIVLVHGVFFRDSKLLNYWGRIPGELINNGATIFYGDHQSALSVKESGEELTKRIMDIVDKTGCNKVNVIAHSKGGLDMRYAISHGLEQYVASLTTINTPHRGCIFADFLLNIAPQGMKKRIANSYNLGAQKLGDTNPDFISAVTDLTNSMCTKFNEITTEFENIYCQSVGSILKRPVTKGKFPLNLSYLLVKHFDGPNDGLVSENSFKWGEKYTFIESKSNYGISHADMIDLNRWNIPGFDVREFYVQLVSDLKQRGL